MATTTYPYYKITMMDGGILRTWGKDTKFKSVEDAEKGVQRRIECMRVIRKAALPDTQIIILEYTKAYTCRIVKIVDYQTNVIIDLL